MGRPRSAEAEAAIVAATLDLLAETGFAGLSVESVAARAGVGKATIYRRWAGKAELVAEAVSTLGEAPERLGGECVRDDLVTLLDRVRRKFQQTRQGRLFLRLVGDALADCAFWAAYRERVVDPGRERVAEVIRRGMRTGELRADLEPGRVVDQLVGPVIYRVISGSNGPVTRRDIEALVDDCLHGLAARDAGK